MKSMRSMMLSCAAVAAMLLGTARAARAEEGVEVAYAERLAALADRYDNTSASSQVKSQLYDAAGRLAEKELRFRRQRYYAAESARDADGMLASLLEWRKLEPDSVFVKSRLIDVYLMRIETADGRLNYLKQIVDAEEVVREVRAHAAAESAAFYVEQSRDQQAMEMLRRSLSLNSLNMDALQLQWRMTVGSSTPLQRLNLLLAMLRSDPSSSNAVLRIAEELAYANMGVESLQWYLHATTMTKALGGLGGEAARNYAAELLIVGDDRGAAGIMAKQLERNATDAETWFLTLLAERKMKDRYAQLRASAMIGLLNRVAEVRKAAGIDQATTRPLATDELVIAVPDFSGDVALIKKAAPAVRAGYAESLVDLVWLLIYHDERFADAAPLIGVIKAISPEDTALAARLEGWSLLRAGKTDEARVRLQAGAESDPMCQLGMINLDRANPAKKTEVADAAGKLIRRYPARLIGAIIRCDIGDLAGPAPVEALGEAMRDSLDRFPKEIIRMSAAPQEFLAMRLTPLQVGHDFGEPILLEVELRNLQDLPLNVGPIGIARDVWLDAQARGLVQATVPGVVLEKVSGPMSIPGSGIIRWVVRLDRGPLAELLQQNVMTAVQVGVYGLTNAVPTDMGIVAGPCGIRGRMNELIDRRAGTLASEVAMRRALATLGATDASARLRLVDQVAAHLAVGAAPGTQAGLKGMEPELRGILLRLTLDQTPAVRGWARYRGAAERVEPGEVVARELGKEPMWYVRVLGVMQAMETPEPMRGTLLATFKGDADVTVRKLAAALELLPAKSATRPTEKPVGRSN